MGWTFTAVTIAWVFFRAKDPASAYYIITHITPVGIPVTNFHLASSLMAILAMIGLDNQLYRNKTIHTLLYSVILLAILIASKNQHSEFIYFQF